MHWQTIPTQEWMESKHTNMVLRLNCLGSLYFFVKFCLQKSRLVDHLHLPIALSLENDNKHFLLELPRDHYKTTLVTEGFTIWRALPFTEADEVAMREFGYDDAWIAWMKRIHDASTRILTVSETITNAVMLGSRFDWHFQNNQIFRGLFPEIIPTSGEQWNNESKQVRCASRGAQGEGTFDFIGVGGALQSRHYRDINEDDTVGKEALESELVMNKTIEYHRLLIGAFESFSRARWLYVANPWSPFDVGAWILKNQSDWKHEHHSALGGCCKNHPLGEPIFPEEFSREDLEQIRNIQGPYLFSHQYLCERINSEDCTFNKDWLRYYEPTPSPLAHQSGKHWLRHLVKDGESVKDIDPRVLIRSMIVDPNHAGERGRARHAVIMTGFDPETDRIYLLDVWAASASYDALMANIYAMAEKWNLYDFWLETVAAQKYLKYHIEYRNKVEKRRLAVRELRTDHGANAKRTRIEALEPLFRAGRIWVRHDQSDFLNEYFAYPGGRTVDILDCLGYAPQTWNAIHAKRILETVHARRDRLTARRSRTGY